MDYFCSSGNLAGAFVTARRKHCPPEKDKPDDDSLENANDIRVATMVTKYEDFAQMTYGTDQVVAVFIYALSNVSPAHVSSTKYFVAIFLSPSPR